MNSNELANEIRVRVSDPYDQARFLGLGDFDTIREVTRCPDCGERQVDEARLWPCVARATDAKDFARRILAAAVVGDLSEDEQDILEDELIRAIEQAAGKIVLHRSGEDDTVIDSNVFRALKIEAGVFAKAYFFRADN